MRRLPQLLAVAVVVSLLGLLIWDVAHSKTGKIAEEVDAGKVVPAFPFTKKRVDTAGTMTLASLRGKVVVLNFWQSYCEPCHTEARTLEAAAKHWAGDKNVVFVGVDEIDFKSAARAFMKRYGVTYPTIADDGSLVGHYGVTGYPETFIVDARGKVVPPHIVGPVNGPKLDTAIRQAQKRTTT